MNPTQAIHSTAKRVLAEAQGHKEWGDKVATYMAGLQDVIERSSRTLVATDPTEQKRLASLAAMATDAQNQVRTTKSDFLNGPILAQALTDAAVLCSMAGAPGASILGCVKAVLEAGIERREHIKLDLHQMRAAVMAQTLRDAAQILQTGAGFDIDANTRKTIDQLRRIVGDPPQGAPKAEETAALAQKMDRLVAAITTFQETQARAVEQQQRAEQVREAAQITAQRQKTGNTVPTLYETAVASGLKIDEEFKKLLEEVDNMVGIHKVKAHLRTMLRSKEIEEDRARFKLKNEPMTYRYIFTGPNGSGKTTVARLIGKIHHALGHITKGHTVETNRAKLIGRHVGDSENNTLETIEKARGGVLVVNEAQLLTQDAKDSGSRDYGPKIMSTLMGEVEDNKENKDMILVLTGPKSDMEEFKSSQQGNTTRLNVELDFGEFNADELLEIYQRQLKERDYKLTEAGLQAARTVCKDVVDWGDSEQSGGRAMRNWADHTVRQQRERVSINIPRAQRNQDNLMAVEAPDLDGFFKFAGHKQETREQVLARINGRIGMTAAKRQIQALLNKAQMNRWDEEDGLPVHSSARHIVIYGDTGTGKTSLAEDIGLLYHSVGLLSRGHTVKVDLGNLTARHVLAAPNMMKEFVKQARGGVLLIDEGQSFAATGASYDIGKDIIAVLNQAMEEFKNDLVVVVAGYKHSIGPFVQGSDSGFGNRFTNFIELDAYGPAELHAIHNLFMSQVGKELTPEADAHVAQAMHVVCDPTDPNYGNGRDARTYFEKVLDRQADRLAVLGRKPTVEERKQIVLSDVEVELPLRPRFNLTPDAGSDQIVLNVSKLLAAGIPPEQVAMLQQLAGGTVPSGMKR